jgi:hypothetical protein
MTFWKPAMLPSSGKEAPNLVDPLLFPVTGYKMMGKVQKKRRLCQSARIRKHRFMCGFHKVSASLFTLTVISTPLQSCQSDISQHKVISAREYFI